MNLASVIELLQQRTGLDPDALGPLLVRSAVRARMHASKMADIDNYVELLGRDQSEFLELIDNVVIPETWFLRGGDLFFYLAEHIRTTLSERKGTDVFRTLCVPCSTGEEPYSLALALAEVGIPGERCRIDAIDISPSNIQQAKLGLFSELSFRQMEPDLRKRYFQPSASAWEIDPTLRSAVRFATGNLLDPRLLIREQPYDLIFCRNLFIYMHPTARQQGLDTLLRLLAIGGLLCLGHAESIDPDDKRFERAGPVGYFLYRRVQNPVSVPPRLLIAPAPRREHRPLPARAPVIWEVPVSRADPLAELLSRARQQADGGQLAEALTLCRSAQNRFDPSADLYSLMGVILQARHEQPEAIQNFRKALYLEPDHPEALMHLMLLYDTQGDRSQADLMRRRLRRIGSSPAREDEK